MKPRMVLRGPTDAAELKHAVIEQAKASYAAGASDMTWEECLTFHAGNMVREPYRWHIGQQNGAWSFVIERIPPDGEDG